MFESQLLDNTHHSTAPSKAQLHTPSATVTASRWQGGQAGEPDKEPLCVEPPLPVSSDGSADIHYNTRDKNKHFWTPPNVLWKGWDHDTPDARRQSSFELTHSTLSSPNPPKPFWRVGFFSLTATGLGKHTVFASSCITGIMKNICLVCERVASSHACSALWLSRPARHSKAVTSGMLTILTGCLQWVGPNRAAVC